MIQELTDIVRSYSKKQRITRLLLIQIAIDQNKASPEDIIEKELIQAIRKSNGEIDEYLKTHERPNKHDSFEDDGAYAD